MTSDPHAPLSDDAPSRRWLGVAFLLVATLVCYLPALRGGFIWDDDQHLTANPAVRTGPGLLYIWLARGATQQYYPLTYTSFWLEHQIFGLNVVPYHLTNVLLHAANAALAWELLRRLRVPGASFAAAVFALHPVQVESVAWISERKNVLATCLMLLSMLTYLRDGRGRGGYWLSLVLFLGALLSKTITCSMPAVIVLVLWWQKRLTRQRLLDLLPFFALGVILGLGTAQMEASRVGARGPEWELSFVERCLIASRAVWFYVGKLLWPAELMFSYPRWTIDARDPRQYVYAAALVATVAALAVGIRRLGRGPLVAVLVFVGMLFPALGFVNVYPMRYTFVADHYQYLSSIAMIALVVGAATTGSRRWMPAAATRPASLATCALLLTVLGVLTWRQTLIYRSAETLWRDTLEKNPSSWLAMHNLAAVLYERAVLDPHRPGARRELAEALPLFERAKRTHPPNLVSGLYHARTLDRLERHDEARVVHERMVEELRRHLEFNPDDTHNRAELGYELARLGRLAEARAEFEEALRRDPRAPLALQGMQELRGLEGAPRSDR